MTDLSTVKRTETDISRALSAPADKTHFRGEASITPMMLASLICTTVVYDKGYLTPLRYR
ncbi:hypothetical protein GCM10009784_08040 [Arthrobacter parietis]|uniref:Uncharacterized protein n=1 Tax=Arthrobacter parietis TaxID=271434 RepID=A0ABN3AQJ4_9MICC